MMQNKKKHRIHLILLIMLFAAGCSTATNTEDALTIPDYQMIDDFSGEQSLFGTEWEGFTDRVMGGRSDISVRKLNEDSIDFIRMSGTVSLENNGGFIQIRLKTDRQVKLELYDGIRLKTRGEGSGYYIFIRTTSSVFPWQYYAAPFPVGTSWQIADVPWSDFGKGDYGTFGKLDVSRIKSIAIVAYGREFSASLDIAEVGLFKFM